MIEPKQERSSLLQIISDDLFGKKSNLLAIFLIAAIIGVSFFTIWVTAEYRSQIVQYRVETKQRVKLENEHLNLLMEENTQSQRTRVDGIATKLGLQPIRKEQELILEKK
ncbi:cell division protein FtsL [Haemophilus paracuniculus]|uniref:Cell division protein FtsL n=1 Tax=Haemophilus paracuniculus TaxID=734 RepID=A0A1T0AQX5_9PAST|nr:cell division protein FtsL [Haemophilus paracuniculus]OOR98457.1 cell division protein FtsL [Haemophilus paracuniculus]